MNNTKHRIPFPQDALLTLNSQKQKLSVNHVKIRKNLYKRSLFSPIKINHINSKLEISLKIQSFFH